ncbi:MgtC/SapB family protein [Halorientalis pallida]|uniref:MgtC/SapB family protein n=1 Tax=Halorientalis pallida TaxID=2479928 RepID=A0A498KXE0_9EURY|nr:MgtC/SapB family protein [Halorientalis pallida]RXK50301.1 MgtC/SapB family protein [Halorientalis pallida]
MAVPPVESLPTLVLRLGIAFGVGALIGLEREQSESGGSFAGSRTFPLFALYGALVGAFYPSVLPVAVAAITVPLTVAYGAKVWIEGDVGLTTLTAALLTVLLGALATHSGQGAVVTIVVGGVVTALLSAKGDLHRFADRIDDAEQRAMVKFVLVVFVVLPVLPDRELDALFGLNPRFVWLMVVFVTGLSFVAYVLSRVVGTERGIALTGILGGFVSSTATTVSMAEQTRDSPGLYQLCAFSTVVAAVVMFPRALVEVAVVNPALLPFVAVPLGAMTAVGAVVAVVVYWRSAVETTVDADIENPFQLRTALFFGALFAAVLFVSDYANAWLGTSGIYATAFVSGLADVDAMTLTLSKLAAEGAVEPGVATTGIVIAASANTLVKAGLAWVIGTRQLGKLVTAVLGVVAAVGLGIAVFL